MSNITEIFKGKGGTTRLIVAGLIGLGIADIITENNYQMSGTVKDRGSFSMRPARENDNDTSDNEGENDSTTEEE